jgi:hypothetical protein
MTADFPFPGAGSPARILSNLPDAVEMVSAGISVREWNDRRLQGSDPRLEVQSNTWFRANRSTS